MPQSKEHPDKGKGHEQKAGKDIPGNQSPATPGKKESEQGQSKSHK